MKLVDLNPRWVGSGGTGVTYAATGEPVPRREGVGIAFDCPCGCDSPVYLPFSNPLDGQPPRETLKHAWRRTGDTFETLTVHPSFWRKDPDGCGFHGWLKNGEITKC